MRKPSTSTLAVLTAVLSVTTACSTTRPAPPASNTPMKSADVALIMRHLAKVNSKGNGSEIDEPAILRAAAERNLSLKPQDLAEHGCPGAATGTDDAKIRAQFICIIKQAADKHEEWKQQRPPGVKSTDYVLKMMFYFNGGLNGQDDVLTTALDSFHRAEADHVFPVYMVWPTGARSTYLEDVGRVRNGRYTQADDYATASTIPARPATDLLRGFAGTPAAWGSSLTEYWNAGIGFGRKGYRVGQDRALRVEGKRIAPDRNLYFSDLPGTSEVEADLDGRASAPGAAVGGVAGTVKQLALAPVRAVTTPALGLGEAGWRNMVRRTRTSVRANGEFPVELSSARDERDTADDCGTLYGEPGPENHRATLQRCFPRGAGGFARFFQWLETCTTGRPIGEGAEGCPLSKDELARVQPILRKNLRISMIGHSMGTIVVNELIQLFPNLPYENLVYMAGAASVRDTARAVAPILRENRGCTKFYNLMLHPMNEAREATAGGVLLSGSLLHYVDEFLEVPKTLPDRTVGQWRNIKMTKHLFPRTAQQWMLFRVYDQEPAQDDRGEPVPTPTTHGSFNDAEMEFWHEDKFWRPAEINFPPPQVRRCEDLFYSRLAPRAVEASAAPWGELIERAKRGETIRIKGADGRIVARIVPPTPEETTAGQPGR